MTTANTTHAYDPLPCEMDQHQFEKDRLPDPMFAQYDGDVPWRHDGRAEPRAANPDGASRRVVFINDVNQPNVYGDGETILKCMSRHTSSG